MIFNIPETRKVLSFKYNIVKTKENSQLCHRETIYLFDSKVNVSVINIEFTFVASKNSNTDTMRYKGRTSVNSVHKS